MIRINLLAVERERTKKTRVAIPAAQRATIGATLILVATVLGVGWWFWSLHQTSIQLDEDISRAETQTQQLRSVLAQVQKFEARKAQLQQRVSLIEQLRSGQGGPVRVLDEISKSLPERLWLTEVRQAGSDFTINGFTASLPSLSDFVASLEATKWFKRPVEILDSQVQSEAKAGDLVKFSIRGSLNDPEAPPPAPPTPPAGRGGRRGGKP
jgi:type IV pilus assembly protein PilN